MLFLSAISLVTISSLRFTEIPILLASYRSSDNLLPTVSLAETFNSLNKLDKYYLSIIWAANALSFTISKNSSLQ